MPEQNSTTKKVVRQGSWFIIKEVAKYIGGALVAAAIASLLTTAGRIFNIDDKELSWIEVWKVAKQSLAIFLQEPLAFAIDAISDRPNRFFAALFLTAGFIVLFVLLKRARNGLREATTERALAVKAGLIGWWPHAKDKSSDGGAPWVDVCDEILRPDNSTLYILAANGIDTFGQPGSPLYDAIQHFRHTVRVILCSPDSDEAVGRANALGMSVEDYKSAILVSERRLKTLHHQHHAIEGRFYDGQPNWKMIITNRTMWLQYYVPDNLHVQETPAWRFNATPDGEGLYHLFHMEFERIWRRCEKKKMKLGGKTEKTD